MSTDTCRHCGRWLLVAPDGLTMAEGDDLNVCRRCITRLTRFADKPELANDEMLAALQRAHALTVRLTGDPPRWERIVPGPTRTVHRGYSQDRGR